MRAQRNRESTVVDFNERQGVLIRKGEGWDIGKLDLASVDTTKIQDLWKFVFDGLLTVKEYKAEMTNPLDEELTAFLECVRTRQEPEVSGEAGLRAVEVAHQVVEAIRAHPW